MQNGIGIKARIVGGVRRTATRRSLFGLGVVGALVPLGVYAASHLGDDGLYDFAPQTVISSSEVNTNFDVLGEHMTTYESAITVDGAGNVGIGTTSPDAKLTIRGGDISIDRYYVGGGYASMSISSETVRESTLNLEGGGVPVGVITAGSAYDPVGWDDGGGSGMAFWTTTYGDTHGPRERMRITSHGNVGIGTTDPAAKLHASGGKAAIVSTSNVNGQFRIANTSDAEASMGFFTGLAESTIGNNTPTYSHGWMIGPSVWSIGTKKFGIGNLTDAKPNLVIVEGGNVGIGTTGPGSKLHVEGPQPTITITSTAERSYGMKVTGAGPGDGLAIRDESGNSEIARFTRGGNVGIGTTSPSQRLHVVGNVTADDYLANSDARLKRDITPLEHASEGIACLQGVTWYWRDPEAAPERQLGLIAQDVEACFPEVVSTDPDGYKRISYSRLVAPLIEAVKDQQALNTSQQREIARLKAEQATLKAEQANLKAEQSATNARLARLEAVLNARQ